jgi:hypothetical protein
VPRGACLVFALLSAAIARETDPWSNSSEKLIYGRTERKSAVNGYTFPTSGLGKRPEHENDGGTVPIRASASFHIINPPRTVTAGRRASLHAEKETKCIGWCQFVEATY